MNLVGALCTALLATAGPVAAQALPPPPRPLEPQTNTFNSSFTLTADQIASLNLSNVVANNVEVTKQFEETNWATGSVLSDPFYTDLPVEASTAPPGTVLKVEEFTDMRAYTLAPGLSLSRIVYQSETVNGTTVPVSAYILWPYMPKSFGKGHKHIPLVSWGHGISGIFPECAPSHIRNLWYQHTAPYTLALQGYAVVATDYAGLGVHQNADGTPIFHQLIANPTAGNDILYAAQAAHAAFPDLLSEEFVVVGHSQGGGAAWGAVQQQLEKKIPGYLGTVAVSPITNATAQMIEQQLSLPLLQVARGMTQLYPGLRLSDMLQPLGIKVLNFLEEVQGCNSVSTTLLNDLIGENIAVAFSLVREEFLLGTLAKAWQNLMVAGEKEFAGPLLVIQGTTDQAVSLTVTKSAVDLTCDLFPESDLEFVTVAEVGHTTTMYASQQIWLGWIEERFANGGGKCGKSSESPRSCRYRTVGTDAPRPLPHYSGELNYFLEYAADSYQVA